MPAELKIVDDTRENARHDPPVDAGTSCCPLELNVSPDWVRDHSSRKTPRLPVIRLGGGPRRAELLRYRASDIERFVDEMARASHSKADTTVNVYMQPIEAGVKQTLDAIYSELTTPEMRRLVKLSENLVRFGTVGIFDGLQVIELKGVGA